MVSENIRLSFIVATGTCFGLFCLVLLVVLLWLVKISGSVLLWLLATGFYVCLVVVSENIRLGYIVATCYGLFLFSPVCCLVVVSEKQARFYCSCIATGLFYLILLVVLLWLVKILGSVLLWLFCLVLFAV